ncbi:hypothetical protein [Ureibacillus manganicus]|uniref:Uncharacterized protein n=1 Tax=Ureibacillus manganicus DSM 26584 TaxID=1384049 RepID=A0A0A3I4Y9_9BACL|nr:hypothetical protein [Ureibacillus manganicus]KGR77738.1 hypothetical protein CD29_13895 [Ureibacillus manganicus DSM 26584]
MTIRILPYLLTFLLSIGAILPYAETAFAENNLIIGTIDDYTDTNSQKQERANVIILPVKSVLSNSEKLDEGKTILDEETKAKAKDILKSLREGKITIEEARAKLKELGIILPKQDNLNEDVTKEKEMSRVENARLKLKELGLKLPKKFEQFINDTQE